jgi:hypothetical protein
MRGKALIVASLLTRPHDPSPLLPYPSVYSCATRLGSVRLGSARLGSARLGSARLGSARLGTEKTPLRLLLRNRGEYFDVTVLACRKYATILYLSFLLH